MGGRGTFAAGHLSEFSYQLDTSYYSDGRFEGVKILKGKPGSGKHGLPESSHSSGAYLKMNDDGTFNTLRVYDSSHALRLEIAYHTENQLGKGKILHYHVYDERFSRNSSGNFARTKAKPIKKNSKIYRQYNKFFKGVVI